MKLTLERDALHAALGRVARIVERRATIPVLSHLHLATADGRLALRGTDLDLEASTDLAADVAQPGIATAPANLLADVVGKVPSGAQIRIELDATCLVLKAGRRRTTLNVLPAEDFPDFGAHEASHRFALEPAAFSTLFGKPEFAISTEETRYYLNGIYLHTIDVEGETKLRAVATDGHRLARWQMSAPNGAAGMPGIIVPRKAVAELRRLAKDATGPIDMALDSRRLVAIVPGKAAPTRLATKLIDGTFPDYLRVIPTGNDKRAILDRAACMAAAERVGCVSTERGRGIRLAFDESRLVLSMKSPDHGDAADEIEAEFDAAPIEIGFNVGYLGDCLGALDGEQVRIELADPGSPTLLRESTGDDFLVVLMPMRV